MIARVKFEGVVKDGKKKSILPDYVDIHVPPDCLKEAKSMFEFWLGKNVYAIKGESGVLHPLGDGCSIKVTEVVEVD